MSLNPQQQAATRRELTENLKRSELTIADLAQALGTDARNITQILNLQVGRIEDPWIVRNYLMRVLAERNITAAPYTALVGNAGDYWFLDNAYIARGQIN